MVLAKELSIEHMRSGENPSDCMTKDLPLALPFGKHAALISNGNLSRLHEPMNTEDVGAHSATVRFDDGNGTTVPCDNSACAETICSIGLCDNGVQDDEDSGWTLVGISAKGNKQIKA